MCGIIFGRRNDNKPIFKNLFKRYLQQSHRGDEGFGYIAIKNGKVTGVKRFKDQKEVYDSLTQEDSSEILFHHRFPTSTPNFPDLNHPITVKNKKLDHNYYVVHNGVLKNEETLRTQHEKEGYKYTTVYQKCEVEKTDNMSKETIIEEKFNDSESLAIELALYFEGHQTDIKAIGSIAFICIQTDKKNVIKNIFYGRNVGNPLIVENVDNMMMFIKSEGQGDKIDSDIIYVEDYKTHTLTEIDIKVGKTDWGYPSYSGYSGYGSNVYNQARDSKITKDDYAMLPRPRGLYDYDDDEYLEEHVVKNYQHALEMGLGSEKEDYDEETEYASFRMEEIEGELSNLYEEQVKCIGMIEEYDQFIEAGVNFDENLYHTSVIEQAKEEKNLELIKRRIEELEDELQEICEITGLESSIIDFVDYNTTQLSEYKDVA